MSARAISKAQLRRLALTAISAVLAVEIVTVGGLAVARGQPPLAWGIGADALLLGSLGLWLAGAETRRTLRPERVLRGALVACVLVEAGAVLLGHGRDAAGVVLTVAELCLQATLVLALVRAARTRGAFWPRARAALASVLPEGLASVVLLEVELLYGAGCALLRLGPAPSQPSDTAFVPLTESRSGWFLPFVALASAVEIPAAYLLIHALWPSATRIHWVLAALQLYGLLWLIGDRWWLARTAHVISAGVLHLQLGRRAEMNVPLHGIERALWLESDTDRRRVQPKGRRNPRLTPLDPPNVHLCLRQPYALRGLFGRQRPAQHLDLFVDRPERFLEALGHPVAASAR